MRKKIVKPFIVIFALITRVGFVQVTHHMVLDLNKHYLYWIGSNSNSSCVWFYSFNFCCYIIVLYSNVSMTSKSFYRLGKVPRVIHAPSIFTHKYSNEFYVSVYFQISLNVIVNLLSSSIWCCKKKLFVCAE